jgi:hypothetical protein
LNIKLLSSRFIDDEIYDLLDGNMKIDDLNDVFKTYFKANQIIITLA